MITTDYWNDQINFDKEFIKYQSLCDSLFKKKFKKMKKELSFSRYCTWKAYIQGNIKKYKYEQLIELSRYLNHQIRGASRLSNIMNMIFIPFLVSIVSSVIIQHLNNREVPPLDVVKILDNLSLSTFLDVIIYLAVLVVLFFILGLLTFITPITLIITMFVFAKATMNLELKKSFYEDFKEIIDESIKTDNIGVRI